MSSESGPGAIPVWRHVGATPLPSTTASHEIIVVGGGPVGLTIALDLGLRGRRVLLINKLDFVAAGSKAICFAKRTLDIWDRLGVGEAMVEKGIIWEKGKVFHGAGRDPIYEFDLQPIKHQKMPAFVNLQQYHAEEILLAALEKLPNVELRWGHEATALRQHANGVELDISASGGNYSAHSDWVIACDGARSRLREMLGLDFDGRVFEDHFLIADIKMRGDLPAERWFWFDPPFNPGRSALLHRQPDDIWRLDFQLGWDIDRAAAIKPDNVARLVRGMLGHNVQFEREWYSIYTFQCRRMRQFVHDRVIFAGDSAHLVSPFGARGCNGGVADAANLGWKLDLVLRGRAPPRLIDSYNEEAIITADENIRRSSRSTDFMTPKSAATMAFRDAVLELAGRFDFARPFVDSGRLSTAVSYEGASFITPDDNANEWDGVPPGSPAVDALTSEGWLLACLAMDSFVLLTLGLGKFDIDGLKQVRAEDLGSAESLLVSRYDLEPGSAYLLRPDQYVAARWRAPRPDDIRQALARAKGAS